MSDTTIDECGFDVEAQEALLGREAEAGAVNTGAVLRRIILLLHSTELFKSGAVDRSSSSRPNSSDYSVIGSFEVEPDSAADDENAVNTQSAQAKTIREIVKEQNLEEFRNFGGVKGVADALASHLENGLPNLDSNTFQYSSCQISQVLSTLFNSFIVAGNNYTVVLLSIAAALSLIFGVKEQGFASGWFINGAIILFTVIALVICSTIHNFTREWRSLKSSWWQKGRTAEVIRGGGTLLVPECSLRVGDIAVIQKGSQIPADGIFINGQALQIDHERETIDENMPFMFYGSRVINGNGRMIVTSTGVDTVWGEMMNQAMAYCPDKKSKLEACLHRLTACGHFTSLVISILIIIVVFVRYTRGPYESDAKGEPTQVETILDCIKEILNGSKLTSRVLTTLSVSLLGIIEGMPFVISVAIFMWNRKTLGGKDSKNDFLAFVRMASVTTICSDKFGGLWDEMEIDKFFIGGDLVSENSVVGHNVLEGLCDGIGSMFLISGRDSKFNPLISWAEAKLGLKVNSVEEQCKVISSEGRGPFKECCQMLMEKSSNGEKRKYLHYNGPTKHVLSLCSHYYDIKGEMQELDDLKRREFEEAIVQHIAEAEAEEMAYARELCVDHETDVVSFETNSAVFMGMIGLKYTKRNDTREVVPILKEGGITTILASEDDVGVLKMIGESSGVFVPDSNDQLVLTAEEFRSWTNEERMKKIKEICVIGNCLPSDKILLIEFLRENGQTVAFLGQKFFDAPALKQADIGLTFGTCSSELARESADISIWHGDITFLVNLIKSSRCFQENIQKFIQLEMIIAISSSLINFIATVFRGNAPITAIGLLLLNLLVAVAGGLALLTGPATEALMKTPPVKSFAGLITKAMRRNVAVQAIYQTAICVALQYKGHAVLGANRGHVKSLIYNAFFMCQMFIKFVVREPKEKNIFRGLFHKNWWFWVAIVMFIICQAVLAVVEAATGSSSGLSLKLWGVCLLIALVSWLLDLAGKCLFGTN